MITEATPIWTVTLNSNGDVQTFKVLGHDEAGAIENAGWRFGLPVGVKAADHMKVVRVERVGTYIAGGAA